MNGRITRYKNYNLLHPNVKRKLSPKSLPLSRRAHLTWPCSRLSPHTHTHRTRTQHVHTHTHPPASLAGPLTAFPGLDHRHELAHPPQGSPAHSFLPQATGRPWVRLSRTLPICESPSCLSVSCLPHQTARPAEARASCYFGTALARASPSLISVEQCL